MELVEKLRIFGSKPDTGSAYHEAADEIEQLTARVRELEEENARLKVMEESALKVCGQLDEVVIALPYDYLDPPDGGDVSLGEQVNRMYSEVKTLRHAVVASQAYAEQLRVALEDNFHFLERHSNRWDGVNGKHPNDVAESTRAILALPRDTSALDAYVAEKVKEYGDEARRQMQHATKAVWQRDLAVEALKSCGVNDGLNGPTQYFDEELVELAIKESEHP